MVMISSQDNPVTDLVISVCQLHGLRKKMQNNCWKMVPPKARILEMLKHPPLLQKKRDVITMISLKQHLVKVHLPFDNCFYLQIANITKTN